VTASDGWYNTKAVVAMIANGVLVTGAQAPHLMGTPEFASGVFICPPKFCGPNLYTAPTLYFSNHRAYNVPVQVTSTKIMHYKNILHFTVEGKEVLSMNIQGAGRVKASEIAKHTMMKHPHLFSGKEVEVSIEYVYSVPDGSGCVDFEFDVEPMGIYTGPKVEEDERPV